MTKQEALERLDRVTMEIIGAHGWHVSNVAGINDENDGSVEWERKYQSAMQDFVKIDQAWKDANALMEWIQSLAE